MHGKSAERLVFNAVNALFLLVVAFVCVAPIVHVVSMSVSDPGLVETKVGIMLVPEGRASFNGYRLIFRNPNIISGYLNTLFYVVVGTTISALLTLVAGYVLSRRRVRYKGIITFLVTFTMLFNGGLIPFYLLVRSIGLINTRLAILLPGALSVMNILVMRTAFMGVPDSLEESARIDGARDLTVLFKILLPVVKATFAVIILFYAVGRWNEWFMSSIFLQDRGLYPLQLLLREILLQNQTTIAGQTAQIVADNLDIYKPLIKYATIVVSTLPILCVYPFVQKYFVTGIMLGSIKG